MERCVNWMTFAATAQTTPLERCVKFHLHQMAIATHISITSTLALMGVIAVKVLAEALPRILVGSRAKDTLILDTHPVSERLINGS